MSDESSKRKRSGSERSQATPKAPPLFCEELIIKQLGLLATCGEAGAARNTPPPQRGERHLSHLAMSSPTTRLTTCRGDTRPVPRHRHREAHH
jgi:hypothetical protein